MELNEKKITQAIEDSIIKKIRSGDVLTLNYQERVDYSPYLKEAYKRIDYNRVMQLITANLEEVIAEKVVNKIITEMGNDIKSLMSRAEIREDFKYFLRSGVETILGRVRKLEYQSEISAEGEN